MKLFAMHAAKAALACGLLACAFAAQAQGTPTVQLRIVGGLAGVNQYTKHEEPFWTRELSRLSGGKASAEIVPFDRAGIRGQEVLRLVQLGAVPFGTSLLSQSAVNDAELSIPDLPGLNADMASLRRSVAAFRPHLEKMLRERYGSELLAMYTYPAQVTFCAKPIAGLESLAGKRVRVSSGPQSDWVSALGGTPVLTPFAEIVSNMRTGNIDCAITGAMSGNTLGLHEVTTHLHTGAVNWGVAAFIANGAAWEALPKDIQQLLRRELPRLEEAIWREAENETAQGVACNTGAAACTGGTKGRMTEVRADAGDATRRREVLTRSVLPAWLKRCGPQCAPVWKQTVGSASGIELP